MGGEKPVTGKQTFVPYRNAVGDFAAGPRKRTSRKTLSRRLRAFFRQSLRPNSERSRLRVRIFGPPPDEHGVRLAALLTLGGGEGFVALRTLGGGLESVEEGAAFAAAPERA